MTFLLDRSTRIILVYIFLGFILGISVVFGKVIPVAMNRSDAQFKTISDAIKAAHAHDTVLVYWEKDVPYFLEHLIIDKPIRIISSSAACDIEDYNYFPTLLSLHYREVVHITSPGVELIGFNIRGPGVRENAGEQTYRSHVGIYLEYPALIRSCTVTGCSTAILAYYKDSDNQVGSRIEHCRIGLAQDVSIDPSIIVQWKNNYGIILLGIRNNQSPIHDRIEECRILNNLRYGIVYTVFNEPVLLNNIVELNRSGPFRIVQHVGVTGQLFWLDKRLPTCVTKRTEPHPKHSESTPSERHPG